jgi:hypothetical protein
LAGRVPACRSSQRHWLTRPSSLGSALTDLIAKLPAIFGGLGLAALGAKVNDASRPAPQTAKSSKAK